MSKKIPLFLYSTQAYLAYVIAERFYNGSHFVWCSPVLNPKALDDLSVYKKIPTSSSPHDIYCGLRKEIEGDHNGSNIHRIKTGLIKGAGIKLGNGIINDSQYAHILHIVKNADLREFKPQLYVISRSQVETKLKVVPFDKMANPLSIEYIIDDLSNNDFEVVEFKD